MKRVSVNVDQIQRWNDDKYRCECKELIDKGVCDEGFIWNPSYCECECDQSCDVGEYLNYKNCKCRKKLADKLTEEFIEIIDEVKIASERNHKNKCTSHNNFCNQHWKWCLFCLLQIHQS